METAKLGKRELKTAVRKNLDFYIGQKVVRSRLKKTLVRRTFDRAIKAGLFLFAVEGSKASAVGLVTEVMMEVI